MRMVARITNVSLEDRELELSKNQRELGDAHPVTLECLFQLADAYRLTGNLEAAHSTVTTLLTLRNEYAPRNEAELQRALLLLSLILGEKGELAISRSLQTAAMEAFSTLEGECGANAVIAARHLDETLSRIGGNEVEVREIRERILACQLETLSEDHIDIVIALRRLALSYREVGDASSAANLERRSIEIAERNAFDKRSTLISRRQLMIDLNKLGNYEELRSVAEKVDEEAELLPKGDPLRRQIKLSAKLLKPLLKRFS
jgi:tetratricopeptide (TPR) repeat protein